MYIGGLISYQGLISLSNYIRKLEINNGEWLEQNIDKQSISLMLLFKCVQLTLLFSLY